MLRTLTRWVGYASLAGAMALGLVDGTRSISVSAIEATPLGTAAVWFYPRQFALLEGFVSQNIHPLLWDPVLLKLLMLPAAGVFFIIGSACLVLGRKPAEALLGS